MIAFWIKLIYWGKYSFDIKCWKYKNRKLIEKLIIKNFNFYKYIIQIIWFKIKNKIERKKGNVAKTVWDNLREYIPN